MRQEWAWVSGDQCGWSGQSGEGRTAVGENRMAMGCETMQGHCKDFAFILKAMGSHWSVLRQVVT